MKRSLYIFLLIALTMPCHVWSQEGASAVTDTNCSFLPVEVGHVKTFGNLSNVSFFDGRLYFYTSQMLFSVECRNGQLGDADIDTAMLVLDADMNYVVRHPDGNLFYTKRNHKGRSLLYERYVDGKGKLAVRQVKFDHFSETVVHPVFSPDGKIMVFSSDYDMGLGGFDLWYSEYANGKWQHPQNLGRNINSSNDEFSPTMMGDYLFFSSNRAGEDFDIYSTRLVSLSQVQGDTVSLFPIGRSGVQRLPAPFNSRMNDFGMAFDMDNHVCFWVSKPNEHQDDRLYALRGRMDCVAYEGTVLRQADEVQPIPYARIAVKARNAGDKALYECQADSMGRYRLFLQPEGVYDVTFSAPNYLSFTEVFDATPSTEEDLVSSWSYSPTLLSYVLRVHHPYYGQALFGSEAGADLTKDGRATLSPLVRFLRENPHLKLNVTAVYGRSRNESFCRLLNQARLQSVMLYFSEAGVSAVDVETHTYEDDYRPSSTATNTYNNALLFYFSER